MTIAHIMLDLETWGTQPGCDIRSIGAVVFDPVKNLVAIPDGDNAELQFYIACKNENDKTSWKGQIKPRIIPGLKYQLTRDPQTVKWWNEQSPEAQAAFANPVDLREACYSFGKWIVKIMYDDGAHTEQPTLKIWANGPQFDISILEAVYHAVKLPVPWHYRAPRDFRTITDAAGMTRDEFSNYGDAHNALHDAIAQAMTVCEAYKRLGLRK